MIQMAKQGEDKDRLRIATRKSPLALAQTHEVKKRLQAVHPQLEIEVVALSSAGDDNLHRPLSGFSEVGIFVKALEQALLRGEADCALHCLKDLPAPLAPGFSLPCFLPREVVNDILVYSARLEVKELRKVATGSLRRRFFLSSHYPDWHFLDLRGNINTRIAKVVKGEVEGIVLAEVGIQRLKKYYQAEPKGAEHRSVSVAAGNEAGNIFLQHLTQVKFFPLSPAILLPSPGQGVLVLQCRSDDRRTISYVEPLNHPPTEVAATMERVVMEKLEGGCRTPLGIWARRDAVAGGYLLEVAMERGGRTVAAQVRGDMGETDLAEKAVRKILEQ